MQWKSLEAFEMHPGWTRPSEALINHHWNVNYESEKYNKKLKLTTKLNLVTSAKE